MQVKVFERVIKLACAYMYIECQYCINFNKYNVHTYEKNLTYHIAYFPQYLILWAKDKVHG